jgi:hypothetical protein
MDGTCRTHRRVELFAKNARMEDITYLEGIYLYGTMMLQLILKKYMRVWN